MNGLDFGMLKRLGVIPDNGATRDDDAISAMYRQGIRDGRLTAADFFTVRDLIQLSSSDPFDPCIHLMLLAMFLNINEGSLCLRLDGDVFKERCGMLCDGQPDLIVASMRQALLDAADRYPRLISRDVSAYMPLIQAGQRLYFQKYHHAERRLYESIRARLAYNPVHLWNPEEIGRVLTEVLVSQPLIKGTSPVQLDLQQRLALWLTMRQQFVIVSGGPGSGKTSIVVNVLRCLIRLGISPRRIRLVAPTGRAAQRILESIRQSLEAFGDTVSDLQIESIEATTAHRLLRFNPTRGDFSYGRFNPLPVDYVIVDEVSMLDVMMAAQLFDAIPLSAGLLFLGDRDQLPSVEAGAVLSDLLPRETGTRMSRFEIEQLPAQFTDAERSEVLRNASVGVLADHIVVLQTCYRSEQAIVRAADAVNQQNVHALDDPSLFRPLLPTLTRTGFQFDFSHDSEREGGRPAGCRVVKVKRSMEMTAVRDAVLTWVRHSMMIRRHSGVNETFLEVIRSLRHRALDDAEDPVVSAALHVLFDTLDASRILTVLRRGAFGCDELNDFIMRLVHSDFDPGSSPRMFTGMPVMATRNVPRLHLNNGDVGLCIRDISGVNVFVFRRMGRFLCIAPDRVPNWAPAFAITVHKSQGSEYDNVLLILPEDDTHRILTREIVYTGLTRARHEVVIIGSRAALIRAVSNRIVRETGMNFYEESANPSASESQEKQ